MKDVERDGIITVKGLSKRTAGADSKWRFTEGASHTAEEEAVGSFLGLTGLRSQTATLSQHCVPGLDSALHGAHYPQRQHSAQAPTWSGFPVSQGRAGAELGHPHVSADLTHLCFTCRLLKIRWTPDPLDSFLNSHSTSSEQTTLLRSADWKKGKISENDLSLSNITLLNVQHYMRGFQKIIVSEKITKIKGVLIPQKKNIQV